MSVSRETESFTQAITWLENIVAQIRLVAAGRRRTVKHGGLLCSRCYSEPPLPGQRYGKQCHAKNQKAWKRKKKGKQNG
jgi:hypothetical protein